MLRCGLLGKKLGHSYSPQIHTRMGDYGYRLFEKSEEELPEFLRSGPWDALNVTIPYKKAVLPYCTSLSEAARKTGSVNTLVRLPEGGLFGDNTDVGGFLATVLSSGLELRGEKCLVFGSGGASAAVCAALDALGAEAVVVSRRGENNYSDLSRHREAAFAVNATPLGMYPENGVSPVDLGLFPRCRGVFDLIYNPARTAFLLQAEALGIPGFGGLQMLVAQAAKSSEDFTGKVIPEERVREIEKELRRETENIVLIGMPGCGKSTVAALLGKAAGREVLDADALIAEQAGRSIPEIFSAEGEEGFRRWETEVLRELGKLSGKVIATGGGCVTREENYPLLHQNGRIFWLRRDLEKLPREGRPLSQAGDLREMARVREPLYRRFADESIDNNFSPEETVRRILEGMA
ncbi:MAG: shikimate kinase [Oscillospiraceae bacterium]|nr:shikimate kinase [Oscillospiraceae bacterium]